MSRTEALPPPAPGLSARRLFEASGLAPAGVGIALAAAGIALLLSITALAGRLPLAFVPGDAHGVLEDLRVAVTHILVVAYLVTAIVYADRTTERSLARMAPLVAAAQADALRRRTPAQRTALRAAGGLGLVLAVLVAWASPGEVSFRPSTWTPENAWHRLLGLAIGFWLARLVMLLVIDSLRLSATARRIRELDLLDLGPLGPLTAHGLTNALIAMGFVAVYALFLIDLRYLPIFALTLVVAALTAAAGLVLPAWGAHRCIQQRKVEELAWCRARIRSSRAALANASARPDRQRLDELLAWEQRVAAVPEWPFDSSTFVRAGLYLLIPLLSWSGGALVERLLDAALD